MEIDACRKCASCCATCIFLNYEEKTDLFKCLIYRNKFRTIVRFHHYDKAYIPLESTEIEEIFNGVKVKVPTDIILRELFHIIFDEHQKESRKVCDIWNCYGKPNKSKRRYGLVKNAKRVMEKRADVIPEFDVLVEILNE